MATLLITSNIDIRVFNCLVDKYGHPLDVTKDSIELDHKGPLRELKFNVPGFQDKDLIQIIGIEDENGIISLSEPMLI